MNPFRRALEILGPNGENWIKGSLSGKRLQYVTEWPVDVRFVDTFCSIGALERVGKEQDSRRLFVLSEQILFQQLEYTQIPAWNDSPETKWEDVKHEFEIAEKQWDTIYGE